jgi:gliding motility-associated-like protein
MTVTTISSLVRGGPFANLDFRIYNEWGNEVFLSDSQSNGWDGTYKNKAQAPGKYIWVVKGETGNGGSFKLTGQFMLIR